MTPQQQDTYVVEKLGIDGWKPGLRCDAGREKEKYPWSCSHHVSWGDHEISPPSIRTLEGMGKLLLALWKCGFIVTLNHDEPAGVEIYVEAIDSWIFEPVEMSESESEGLPNAVANLAFAALQGKQP